MAVSNINKVKSSDLELKDKLVALNRVTKVTKGGRTFTFAAIVVVGNENGVVGHGLGKAKEVQEAIAKGIDDAKKKAAETATDAVLKLVGKAVEQQDLDEHYEAGRLARRAGRASVGRRRGAHRLSGAAADLPRGARQRVVAPDAHRSGPRCFRRLTPVNGGRALHQVG
jgi:hypothetical protein